MARAFWLLVVAIALVAPWSPQAKAEYPTPANYSTSWQLKFEYGKPTRIVLNVPGKSTPQAYWYLPFSVTNATNRVQMYFPVFEMVMEDGKVVRSDQGIPQAVANEIRRQQGNRFLQPLTQTAGELRVGEDETKHSAAIWPEQDPHMARFSILVGGLSGEMAKVKNAQGEEVILRKTLQLNYLVRGDEVYPGEDEVNENASQWIMR